MHSYREEIDKFEWKINWGEDEAGSVFLKKVIIHCAVNDQDWTTLEKKSSLNFSRGWYLVLIVKHNILGSMTMLSDTREQQILAQKKKNYF